MVTARGGARFQLTRRGARWAVISGIICILGGIEFGWLVLALEHHDAVLRDRGRDASAVVVSTPKAPGSSSRPPTGDWSTPALPQKSDREIRSWVSS